MLEAAHHDPLRAQEIEGQVSRVWWERYLADREERLAAEAALRNRPRPQPGHSFLPIPEQRTRYTLSPDGQLLAA